MRDHKSIISATGSDEEISLGTGAAINTVRSWKQRNSIPSEHWKWFSEQGQTTLEELATVAANAKQDSPAEEAAA